MQRWMGTYVRFPACWVVERRTGVPGMSAARVAACYRLYAAYCVETAQQISDSARKVTLLSMAQAWMKLAESVEREVPTIEDGELSQ